MPMALSVLYVAFPKPCRNIGTTPAVAASLTPKAHHLVFMGGGEGTKCKVACEHYNSLLSECISIMKIKTNSEL